MFAYIKYVQLSLEKELIILAIRTENKGNENKLWRDIIQISEVSTKVVNNHILSKDLIMVISLQSHKYGGLQLVTVNIGVSAITSITFMSYFDCTKPY